MASSIGNGQVKLNNGSVVKAQVGGWYDGQQYAANGSLASPGQFNPGVSGQSGQAPVQNAADAAYLTSRGDTGANAALVTQPQNNGGGGAPAPGSGSGLGYTAPNAPTIDLQGLYNNLVTKSGITDKQSQLTKLEQAKNTELSTINDNPFLSEGDRTGRAAKLESDYQNEAAPIQNNIAMAQADNQVQLNLATQQYNIDEGAYQQKVSQVNSLLSSGALDNANAQDIAQIAQATGLSTGMVQSVISTSQQAKAAQNKPQLQLVDDGTHQSVVAIDPNTGNVINTQILGPSSVKSGGGSGSSGSSKTDLLNEYIPQYDDVLSKMVFTGGASAGKISPQNWNAALADWVSKGLSVADFVSRFENKYVDKTYLPQYQGAK